jgi:hypothetical protein
MLRVIAVRTGTKYSKWYEDNLKYMIDTYSGLDYDEFAVIREDLYDEDTGSFNKLQMFDKFKDGQNIYFDLDMLIKGNCNHLLRKEFTVCHAHWRKAYHTPINSSIMSWEGDASYINKVFHESDKQYMFTKYYRGEDQYIYENAKHNTYNEKDGYVSFQTVTEETDAAVYLFNQRYEKLIEKNWYTKYQIPTQNS